MNAKPACIQNALSENSVPCSGKEPNNTVPTVRLHIWLEAAEGVFFGMGREFLLQGIEKHGSLKKAAEAMGMSYRAAWGKIKTTEKILNVSLIEKRGGNRSGYQVTPEGHRLMEKFDYWFTCVESEAIRLAEEIFPFEVKNFWDRNKTF